MLKRLAIFLVCFQLVSCDPAALQKIMDGVGELSETPLSNADIANGLKEALEIGIGKGAQKLSLEDGYYKSAYKILLPEEARKVTEKLQGVPGFTNLEEAILELKETEFKEVFKEDLEKKRAYVRDVQIDTDVEMHIPDDYVNNIQERLNLYTLLNRVEDEAGLEKFETSLRDRFGKVPWQINELFDGMRLRWIAKLLGFSRIILKNNKLRCYFVENPQSPYYDSKVFQSLFQYIGAKGHKVGLSIKKSPRHLILVKGYCLHIKSLLIPKPA